MDYIIKVCHGGTCCRNFATVVKKNIEKEIQKRNLMNISVEECRCVGLCSQAPNIAIFNAKEESFKIKTEINPGKVIQHLSHLFPDITP